MTRTFLVKLHQWLDDIVFESQFELLWILEMKPGILKNTIASACLWFVPICWRRVRPKVAHTALSAQTVHTMWHMYVDRLDLIRLDWIGLRADSVQENNCWGRLWSKVAHPALSAQTVHTRYVTRRQVHCVTQKQVDWENSIWLLHQPSWNPRHPVGL